jgi:hypothetical protein
MARRKIKNREALVEKHVQLLERSFDDFEKQMDFLLLKLPDEAICWRDAVSQDALKAGP